MSRSRIKVTEFLRNECEELAKQMPEFDCNSRTVLELAERLQMKFPLAGFRTDEALMGNALFSVDAWCEFLLVVLEIRKSYGKMRERQRLRVNPRSVLVHTYHSGCLSRSRFLAIGEEDH